MNRKIAYSTIIIMGSLIMSCMPEHLQKYVKEPTSVSESQSTVSTKTNATSTGVNSRIHVIDAKTYRFDFVKKQVWDAALTVILRNYNISIANQDDGLITTEWDTFYLNDKILRNKISLRINPVTNNNLELVIHNSLERLQDKATVGTVGAIWLPDSDNNSEISRIINNMAILLNQPEVIVPTGNVSRNIQ